MAIVTMKRLSLLALKADKENIYNALIRTASVELKRCEDLPNCVVCDNSADREVVAERVKRAEEAVSYVSEQVDRFNATHAKSQAVTPDKNSFARPKTEVNFDDFIGFDKKAAAVEREISDLFALRDKLAELNGQHLPTPSCRTRQPGTATPSVRLCACALFRRRNLPT